MAEGVGERSPLITAEDTEDLVVPATLHRCAQSIKSALDCEQVFHRLCEEGVLPLAAAGSVNRLLPPDNKARQANNIMIWLRTAKRAEFERFIAIVKEMGVGNRSQEELAEKLEEEYARLRDDPEAAQQLAQKFSEDLEGVLPSNVVVVGQDPACYACREFCFSCHCKFCLPLVVVYMLLLVVVSPAAYFLLWRTPLDNSTVQPLPRLVSGNSHVQVDLGKYQNEISSVSMSVNCSGEIFITGSSNCNALNRTTFKHMAIEPMQYLLAGSTLTVQYINQKLHNFMVVKSLNSYQAACPCSKSVYDVCFSTASPPPDSGDDGDECARICSLRPCSDPRLKGEVDCINTTSTSTNYQIKHDDYYYLEFGLPCPDFKTIYAKNYDNSQFQSADFLNYTLRRDPTNSYNKHSVTFPVSGGSFHGDDLCILFSARCPSDRVAYAVDYVVVATPTSNHHVFVVWGMMVLLGMILVLAQVTIFCWSWRRRIRRKKIKPIN